SIVVLDSGGNVKAFEREDGSSNLRFQIAHGKAYGAIGFGANTRKLSEIAVERPQFIAGVTSAFRGALVPSPGGVLVRNNRGAVIGAIGVTGDTGDNDELAAIAGIEAAGFKTSV
ncbi:MAG: heme-binding protein, partial [Fimbriimonadaceae bacterium]|nr:heme-binding protein [Alphaproteobacteria bacterium]